MANIPDATLFKVEADVEVRWADTDALAHVNNAAFFSFFEEARTRYLDRVAPELRLTATGPGIILARTGCDFYLPVTYPARLKVGCRTLRLGRSSWEVEHLVRDAMSGETYSLGSAVLVWFDFAKNAKIPMPDDVRERIEMLEGKRF
jgi:acyl-CoA thioester hydrolase